MTQRRRIDVSNSPDRRAQQLTQEEDPVHTPVDDGITASVPPDAPKGQKIGQADDRTPESTFPKASRDLSPEPNYEIDGGYDDETLVELASFADNLPINLFKNVEKGAVEELPWTSSPKVGPSSSTPPVATRKRDMRSLRTRHHK